MLKIVKLFPQCNDQIKKSKTGRFIPHISIGNFKNEQEVKAYIEKIKKIWKPIDFIVKELYILVRQSIDPFEVKSIVPLGIKTPPYFGHGSVGTEGEDIIGRTLVIASLLPNTNNKMLEDIFINYGCKPKNVEMTLNPDGKFRTCGIIEFETRKEANEALNNFKCDSHPNSFVKPLYLMVFPGTFRDCCSLTAVKDQGLPF